MGFSAVAIGEGAAMAGEGAGMAMTIGATASTAAMAGEGLAVAGTVAAGGAFTSAAGIAMGAVGSAVAGSSLLSTLGTIGSVVQIGSSLIGAQGAYSGYQAQAAAANYNAGLAQQNAAAATQAANMTMAAGEVQAANQSLATRANVGAIKAAQAASGVDISSGSTLDVQSSAAALGQLNAITLRSNAARTAYGYQTQAVSDTAQGKLDTYQAQTDEAAAPIAAATTALGGIGSAASSYNNFLMKGGDGGALSDILS